MGSCERLRPELSRVADAEASPEEAMAVARHVSDCTACRIQLARERRLGSMLEQGLEDPLQVGEDFVQSVMDALPQGPPPVPRRRKRRYLKLAGLGAWIALAPALLPRSLPLEGMTSSMPAFGSPDLGGGERLLSALIGLARSLPVALDSASSFLPPMHLTVGVAGVALTLALTTALAAGCALTMVAAAMGTDLFSRVRK